MNLPQNDPGDRWENGPADHKGIVPNGIVWNVRNDPCLPHRDHLEMSGQLASVVLDYAVDADRHLTLNRRVYWPTLRAKRDDVRGYLRYYFDDKCLPRIVSGDRILGPFHSPVRSITFNGIFTVVHDVDAELQLTRRLFPSPGEAGVIEYCTLNYTGNVSRAISLLAAKQPEQTTPFHVGIEIDSTGSFTLAPGHSTSFGLIYYAGASSLSSSGIDSAGELARREQWLGGVSRSLQLETPDPVIDRMFDLAKVRSAESLFQTKIGLVHSPGGERYYGGIWANDQAEYSGPFFPFLGDVTANEAALNAYRQFARYMNPAFTPLPYALEVEGDRVMSSLERGDAAMIAYGASRFALAFGDEAVGNELWKLVEWCLEFCRRKLTDEGVVASATDELEGRFSTGDANLSTSSLYYGGLITGAALARAVGLSPDLCDSYLDQAASLAQAINTTFGARLNGYDTYQYHEGNKILRAWICLPLTVGLLDRAEGTIGALFSRHLWSPDGIATQAGEKTYWDRATLYALRGALMAGATEVGMKHLRAYSRRRLLGDHVPYAVEANPEGGQAHLSAESALFCRVITEGLFGIIPVSFTEFTCTPRLPMGWNDMSLRNVQAFRHSFDLRVERRQQRLYLHVVINGTAVIEQDIYDGDTVHLNLMNTALAFEQDH
jgi:hypothetical protein